MAKFKGEYHETLYRICTYAVYFMAGCRYGYVCWCLSSPIRTNNNFMGIAL